MSTVVVAAGLAAASAAALVSAPRVAGRRLSEVGAVPVPADLRPSPVLWRSGLPLASLRRRSTPVLVALALGAAGALADGVALGVLAAVVTLVVGRAAARRGAESAQQSERSRAVEACLALAAELQAGRVPADALDAAAEVAVGPTRRALSAASRAAALGGDVPAALVAPDAAAPELLRALGACWKVCSRAGSGLAPAVERLADGLTADAARRRALDAELAGPRATAGLLAVLPAAGVLLAAGLGADPLHVLLHTPLGIACLTAGVGLDLLGLLWTSRLVRQALRSS